MSDKDTLHAALRTSLPLFIQRVFMEVSSGDIYEHNWHVDAIAFLLSSAQKGELNRLIVNMPPRHLKSIAISVAYIAWLLGHNPKLRIICVSYSQDLANLFSRKTKLVMESKWYQECFPKTILSNEKNTQAEFETTEGGSRYATSIGGVLTGLGCDYLIIDDPCKADDAQSKTKLNQVNEWFFQTALNRLNQPNTGRIILVQQRFHQADLSGTLLDGGGFHHLNLPAIAEKDESIPIAPGKYHFRKAGQALHAERLSLQQLEQKRLSMGAVVFAAQFQQRPAPAGGAIVKINWFRKYKHFHMPPFPLRLGDVIVQSWDLAYTMEEHSCFTVCTTWLYRNHRFYLLDVLRTKLESPEVIKLIPKHASLWDAERVIMETTGVGRAILQALKAQDPGLYIPYTPKLDKATRLMSVAHLVECGRVYLPDSAPWLEEFQQELLNFPNSKFDDQVDSFSQGLTWLKNWTPAPPPEFYLDDKK